MRNLKIELICPSNSYEPSAAVIDYLADSVFQDGGTYFKRLNFGGRRVSYNTQRDRRKSSAYERYCEFYRRVAHNRVLIAAFADPPVYDVDGAVTPPHSWSSNSVERAIGRGNKSQGLCIEHAKWDETGGLALVLSVELKHIFSETWRGYKDYEFTAASLCAELEYFGKRNEYGLEICESCELTGAHLVLAGCNPGGFLVLPGAGRLNTLLKQYRKTEVEPEERARFKVAPKMTEKRAKQLFPDVDFRAANKDLASLAKPLEETYNGGLKVLLPGDVGE